MNADSFFRLPTMPPEGIDEAKWGDWIEGPFEDRRSGGMPDVQEVRFKGEWWHRFKEPETSFTEHDACAACFGPHSVPMLYQTTNTEDGRILGRVSTELRDGKPVRIVWTALGYDLVRKSDEVAA